MMQTRNPPAEDRIVCVAQIFVSLSETVVFIETEWDPRYAQMPETMMEMADLIYVVQRGVPSSGLATH
jgi:hypothetical protein